jgi:hypothetical protein
MPDDRTFSNVDFYQNVVSQLSTWASHQTLLCDPKWFLQGQYYQEWGICLVRLGVGLRASCFYKASGLLFELLPNAFWSSYFGDVTSCTICPALPWAITLQISASPIARVTCMSHWCPPCLEDKEHRSAFTCFRLESEFVPFILLFSADSVLELKKWKHKSTH